jgi:hypothetical protein
VHKISHRSSAIFSVNPNTVLARIGPGTALARTQR